MAVLTDLPMELLEEIFLNLTSIDDVHYFARVCKSTHKVIQRAKIYTEIMRSVIRQSPALRYDVQLCRLLKMHSDIVEQGEPIQVTTMGPNGQLSTDLNSWERSLGLAIADRSYLIHCCAETLPDEDVYEILARWQGLRVLQNLWLTRQLKEHDYLAVSDTADTDDFIRAYDLVNDRDEDFHDGQSAARSSLEAEFYTRFDADQKGRFHAAVTSLWLLNEIRWILTNFTYTANTFAVPLTILDKCKEHLDEQTETPLLDHLDRYAVHSFLYHHLLPLHSPALSDQCSSKLPLTFPSELEKEPVYCTRLLQLFLVAGQTYLQPPDIIDLAVRDKLRRKPPYMMTRLPASTELHIRSTSAEPFPPGFDLTSTGEDGFRLASLSLGNLTLFQRATIAQTSLHPAPQINATPLNGLFTDDDLLSTWLEERTLMYFDMYMRRDRRDIREVFEKRWRKTRWMVWWWAASEDKARMKMERWRRA